MIREYNIIQHAKKYRNSSREDLLLLNSITSYGKKITLGSVEVGVWIRDLHMILQK